MHRLNETRTKGAFAGVRARVSREQTYTAWRDGASWQGALTGRVIAIDDAGNITIVAYTEAGRQRRELVVYSRVPGSAWQTAPVPVPSISEYPVFGPDTAIDLRRC